MTVKEIKNILGDKHLSKARGQNLLLDENIGRKFADLLSLTHGKRILEIGPGLGIITKYLKNRGFEVIGVEIDPDFCSYLKTSGVNVLCEDFLKMHLDSSAPEVVVGALPFSMSLPILKKIKDNRDKIKEWIFVLQKEVAERFTAEPRSKSYSSLTVLFNILYDIRCEFEIKPEAFFPKPEVFSTVIKGIINKNPIIEVNEVFEKFLKDIFRYKRKTLKNNLFDYNIELVSIDLKRRAETLTKDEAVQLYRECCKSNQ
ncbi:ribosomal RNA small subunit methyltransferase A [candidate division WOR-3 bacterium]|nr:ribosomal RNA small subunit methyltransferase A [candidate division WOR-3 bacterium]